MRRRSIVPQWATKRFLSGMAHSECDVLLRKAERQLFSVVLVLIKNTGFRKRGGDDLTRKGREIKCAPQNCSTEGRHGRTSVKQTMRL